VIKNNTHTLELLGLQRPSHTPIHTSTEKWGLWDREKRKRNGSRSL